MRTKDQGTLDKILKFVNKYYQENRVAPTISEVAAGVGVARSTTHRYIQELSDRDLLDYGRGILSAPESAKMKTAYIAAPLVGSIYCGSPEEEEENVEEYVSLPVSLFGKSTLFSEPEKRVFFSNTLCIFSFEEFHDGDDAHGNQSSPENR